MAKKFKYQRRDYADARKRAEQSSSNRDSFVKDVVSLFKPAEGDNVLRILPPTWEDPKHYGVDLFVHYQVGSDNSAYLCPAAMHKQFPKAVEDPHCPICEERAVADREGDKDYAKRLKAVKRVLVYVIDRDKEKEGIKAWSMPWTVDRDLALQATDSRTQEYLPIDDPDEGYDVTITRTGTNERTEYGIRIARRSTPLNMDEDMEDFIVENPLPSLLQFYPSEYIKEVFEGGLATAASTEPSTPNRKGRSEEEDDEPKKTSEPRRRSSREEKEEHTWETVHALAGEELDDLINDTGLDLDPSNFETDDDLADAICEALEIEKPKRTASPQRRSRRAEKAEEVEKEEDEEEEVAAAAEEDDEPEEKPRRSGIRDRLRNMRSKRDED